MSTAIERGNIPLSEANRASVESTNPLIKGYVALQVLRDNLAARLHQILSQPITPRSSPLRDEEYPSDYDIVKAEKAALQPEDPSVSWIKRLGPFALAGTGLVIACAPQDVKKPAIVEPAAAAPAETPTSTPQPTAKSDLATAQAKPAVEPGGSAKPEETSAKVPVQEVLTQERLLAKVDDLITLAQNPDKELIVKYGLLTGSLDANTQEIINGDKNPPPGVFVKRGLNDLKTALETGNNPEAKAIIKDIVERSLLGYIFTPAGTDVAGSTVRLTDEEIKAIDPNNNFPSLKAKGRRGEVSVVRKGLSVELVRFSNSLLIGK